MAATIMGSLIVSAASADQSDPRLRALFSDLEAAPNA
jgi:hypothetical protein